MPLSDMLFANTHNVEQMVDIKHKKSVDKVLLKVIKTVRDRASITGWVKPTSDLREEFHVTDRQMRSICSALGSYYNVYLDHDQMKTPGDIIGTIKAHKAQATDSLYLIDSGTLDRDEDDELEPQENLEVRPEIIEVSEPGVPSDIPIPEHSEPSIEGGDEEEASTESLLLAGVLASAIGAGTAMFKISHDRKAMMEEEKLKELKKQEKTFNDNYSVICRYVRANCLNEPFFSGKRKIFPLKLVTDTFNTFFSRYRKILTMPLPRAKEDVNAYKNRLIHYFGGKLTTVEVPVQKATMSLFEAGYLEARQVQNMTSLSIRWKEEILKVWKIINESVGPKYKPALDEVGVSDYAKFGGAQPVNRTWHLEWASEFKEVTSQIFNHLKKKQDSIIKATKNQPPAKKVIPIDAVKAVGKSNENFVDAAIVGGGVVAVAVMISKLYQDRNWDKLVEYMSEHYDEICSDIRKNHKDDPAFAKNRAILYHVNALKNTFAARLIQLKKLLGMPMPYEETKLGVFSSQEDIEQYKAKLYAYFGPTKIGSPHPVMEHRVKPGEPSYLTLEEAGYLNLMAVKALITKIKECFDAQDAVDKKLFFFEKKEEGQKYKSLMESMKILDHFHALYKEEWTEHFSTHVMKSIVNGLEGKSNKEIGSEQLQPKVEASMESMVPQETSTGWGDMLDSF